MSNVRFSQKGYDGFSMSNRARAAYDQGEKPISKILSADASALTALCHQYAPGVIAAPLTVKETRDIMRRWGASSWHHTSSRANATEFYHVAALFDCEGQGHLEDWEDVLNDERVARFVSRIGRWAQENR